MGCKILDVGTVRDSKQVLLISGHNKARTLCHCVEGGVDHAWTISALQMLPDGIVAYDEAACGELKVRLHPCSLRPM